MANQINTGQITLAEQIKSMSDQQLKIKIGELAILWENFLEYKNELETRKNQTNPIPQATTNNLQEIAEILEKKQKWALSKEEREKIKIILQSHLQSQKNEGKKLEDTTNATIADLTAKLNDNTLQLESQKKAYSELLDADEKLITPAEYTKRRRLRSIRNKFSSLKTNPTKALAYFITKTSFWKWGKATASIKKASIFIKTLSSFSTMGTNQLSKIKGEIQEAIDDMRPEEKDTITTKHIKKTIIEEVATTANKCFEQLTKPIDTKFAI
jgi:hypothetical protein